MLVPVLVLVLVLVPAPSPGHHTRCTVHCTQHTGRGEISQLQVTHIESDIGQQLGISEWIAAIAIHMAIGNMASYFKIDQVHTTCYKYRHS